MTAELETGHADLLTALRETFKGDHPGRIGVAVSGGSDSVALLHLLARYMAPLGVKVHAATVDHGLRAAAADEARAVSRQAEAWGVPHRVLEWRGWDGTGNLQDRAREARYALLAAWAQDAGIEVVALGHTADDQAETVLMRLARAAGPSGLAGMAPRRARHGVTFVRPLLGIRRAQLRDYLGAEGIRWVDDPGNADPRFERVRAREALSVLSSLGLTAETLVEVAAIQARCRDALDWYAFLAARDHVRIDAGDVIINARGFRTLPEETARRLLVHSVQWIAGSDYPPRRGSVANALQAARRGVSATLCGCRVLHQRGEIRVCREYAAVRGHTVPQGRVWDGRWRINGPGLDQAEVRPLGRRGLLQCPQWRQTGRPHAGLMATPGLWQDDRLVAAPVAGFAGEWQADLLGGDEAFFTSLLAH